MTTDDGPCSVCFHNYRRHGGCSDRCPCHCHVPEGRSTLRVGIAKPAARKPKEATTLFPFQHKGVLKIHRFGGRALVADDMGLGKTVQSLFYLKNFYPCPDRPAVVVCPSSVKYQWEEEAKLHVNVRSMVLEGTRPHHTFLPGRVPPLIILNWDILSHWADWLKALRPGLVIGDEVHAIKNRRSKRYRAFRKLCKGVPHVLGLTGTPVLNRPEEIWPVCNILRPEEFSSFFEFAQRFCQARKAPWGWEYKGAKNLKELNELLKDTCMIRRRFKDVFDQLPEVTRVVVPVPLSDEAQYRKAERDFIGWLRGFSWTRASKAERAQYLAKGAYLKRLVGELKLPFAAKWIEEFHANGGEKLITFGVHKRVLRPLHARFKGSVLVDGEVTGKRRKQTFDHFTHTRGCRDLFGNILAAGTGWNGQAAHAVAFVELGWRPADQSQGEARANRIGQKYPVTAYYLISPNTIEERLMKVLAKKQEISDQAVDGMDGLNDETAVFNEVVQTMLKEYK